MSHKAVWELHKVTERLTFDLFSLKCHQFAIYPLKGCQINNDSWGLGKSEVNLTLESWQSYIIISSLGSSECLCQIWIHFHKVFKRFCHLNDTYWRISNNVRWTDNSENLVHAEAEEKTSKTAWIWTARFNLTAFHSLENRRTHCQLWKPNGFECAECISIPWCNLQLRPEESCLGRSADLLPSLHAASPCHPYRPGNKPSARTHPWHSRAVVHSHTL